MVNPLNSVESRPRLGIMRSKFSELEAASTALREQLAKAEASLADLTEKNENLTGATFCHSSDLYRVTHLVGNNLPLT